jgi:hypothetical protein
MLGNRGNSKYQFELPVADKTMFWAIVWSLAALLLQLTFSLTDSSGDRPLWYRALLLLVVQCTGSIAAAGLCWRNWRQSRLANGSKLWIWWGVGLGFWAIGRIATAYWELQLSNDPLGSPVDIALVIAHICWLTGGLQAIFAKRIAFESADLAIAAAIALGTAASAQIPAAIFPAAVDALANSPLRQHLTQFYLAGDAILFGIAAAYLVAFRGGKITKAWKAATIAFGSFAIADAWLAYAATRFPTYQSGCLLEVFWAIGVVAIGVAATSDSQSQT